MLLKNKCLTYKNNQNNKRSFFLIRADMAHIYLVIDINMFTEQDSYFIDAIV